MNKHRMTEPRTLSRSEEELLDELSEQMTHFELALVVSKNAFEQWVIRCGSAAGMKGYSALEVLVLHHIEKSYRPKRLADICFSLKIEDTHVVSYALKKLVKAGIVESRKQGKEAFFETTDTGKKIVSSYRELRRKYLIRSMALLAQSEEDIDQYTRWLGALSGLYDQAARNIEFSS